MQTMHIEDIGFRQLQLTKLKLTHEIGYGNTQSRMRDPATPHKESIPQ